MYHSTITTVTHYDLPPPSLFPSLALILWDTISRYNRTRTSKPTDLSADMLDTSAQLLAVQLLPFVQLGEDLDEMMLSSVVVSLRQMKGSC